MITSLSKLSALIQEGSVPTWLREAVNTKKDEIVRALEERGSYTLTGPGGVEVIITRVQAAAA
jgi:hypothetical protein